MKNTIRVSWLFLNYSETEHSELFQRNHELRNYHTDVIDEIDIKITSKFIVLVSTNENELEYIGVGVKGNKTASKKRNFKVTEINRFNPKINIDLINSKLSKRNQEYFVSLFGNEKSVISNGFHKEFLLNITNPNFAYRKTVYDVMSSLLNNRSQKEYDNPTVYFERDALVFSLQLSDVYDQYKGFFNDEPIDTPTFLKKIKDIPLREDQMILNDMNYFGDWNRISEHITSTNTFSNGFNRLSVMYVNRTPIEETLGTDLIYIDEKNKFFIMIQYKRLLKESNEYRYRPLNDKNYLKEKEAMDHFLLKFSQNDSKEEFRYNNEIFYFKLCKSLQKSTNRTLVDGMYLSKKHMEFLLEHKITDGPRGGKYLGLDNVKNYLNNSTFIKLIQTGLIGSNFDEYSEIESIIVELINTGHSVLLTERMKVD